MIDKSFTPGEKREEGKEFLPSFNPIPAPGEQKARLMRGILSEDVPVKIIPERIPSRNPGMLDIALRDTGDGRATIVFPSPDRVPATTEFIDVKTEGGTVSIPVIPADPADPGLIIDINRNPESLELEERARRMRDAGPNPHLPI